MTRYELRCGDDEPISPLSDAHLRALILAGLVQPSDELRLAGGAAGRAIGEHPAFSDDFETLKLRQALYQLLSPPTGAADVDPTQRAALALMFGAHSSVASPAPQAPPPVASAPSAPAQMTGSLKTRPRPSRTRTGELSLDVEIVIDQALDASWVDGESFATRDLLGYDPEAELMTRYWAMISAEDFTGALAAFDQFTERTRGNPEIEITAALARFMVSPQREDRLVELRRAEALVAANPDNTRARLVAARMNTTLRYHPQAAKHLEYAVRLAPEREDLRAALAELREGMG